MTAVSKYIYFNVLDDIVDEYNNTYHRTIKGKLIDVKNDSFPKYEESNKNVSAKIYAPNWSKELFLIKKKKNAVPLT